MQSLDFKFTQEVDSAHIITLKHNSISEKYAQRCAESCKNII